MGWEKFTLRADGQVQSAGESRCAAADNDTHPLCLSSYKPEEYVILQFRKMTSLTKYPIPSLVCTDAFIILSPRLSVRARGGNKGFA